MKSTTEILDEFAQDKGFNNWTHLLIYEERCTANITSYVTKAMQLYAQQFIDSANEIIGPASEILDENYSEDYENWWSAQEVNEF